MCGFAGQTEVLCDDPRFQRPQTPTFTNVVPEAVQRCVAPGMERALRTRGCDMPVMQVGAIRANCENGGYRKYLDPNYVPR